MDINTIYKYFLRSSGVSIDTRTIAKNNLFFAIKGDRFDGNQFSQKALDSGAMVIVSDEPSAKEIFGDKVLVVRNTLETLQNLARYNRKVMPAKIIAFTGSNGKTTTKELLNACLSQKYKCLATEGNFNNHIGVPLTLLNLKPDHEFGIIEMGANHKDEIDFLCKIALPDYGFITNIGKAHMEGFGGVEGIKIGKSEIFRHITATDGNIFVNENDNVVLSLLPKESKIIRFKSDEFKIVPSELFLSLIYNDTIIRSNLTGEYNQLNMAVAISVATHFDVSLSECQKAIESYHPTNNRSQVIEKDNTTIILDAYNANPSSMMESINNAYRISNGDLTLILGDMLELGVYSEKEHLEICEHIESLNLKNVFYVGREFKKQEGLFDASFHDNVEELNSILDLDNIKSQFVLLKGSRGIGLEKFLTTK